MTRFIQPTVRYKGAGVVDGARWIELTGTLQAIHEFGRVMVPVGFMSDGASIPKFAWSIVGHPFSGYFPAAVVHDYLYRAGCKPDLSRKQADKMLRDLMRCLGYGWLSSRTFYLAVRIGGRKSWKKKNV